MLKSVLLGYYILTEKLKNLKKSQTENKHRSSPKKRTKQKKKFDHSKSEQTKWETNQP